MLNTGVPIYFPNLSFPPFREGIFFPKSKRAIEVFPKPISFPQPLLPLFPISFYPRFLLLFSFFLPSLFFFFPLPLSFSLIFHLFFPWPILSPPGGVKMENIYPCMKMNGRQTFLSKSVCYHPIIPTNTNGVCYVPIIHTFEIETGGKRSLKSTKKHSLLVTLKFRVS